MTLLKVDIEHLNDLTRGFTHVFYFIQNGKDAFYSDSIINCTGYSAEEILKLPDRLHSIVYPDDKRKVKQNSMEFQSDNFKTSNEFAYRINGKDGKIIWLKEITSVVRDGIGHIIEQKSFYFDITSVIGADDELIKNYEKLKELNASKDQFVSIVSHDLRSPFTTLLGFSEILMNEKDLSDQEKEEYIRYIYDASKSQLQLVNCLLDWSRLQTGRVKVEPTRLNVKVAVSNAVTPLTGDAVRKNIDVKLDIPHDLNISADERLFNQAMMNLVSNAIRFTPNGKQINIYSQRFKEGLIEIVVKDEGVGIAEEHHGKLFRIDQKFILVGTDGEKGSGLGLTLVREIIDKHGGDVWFYSQPDEGSEFHFTIPEAKNTILIVENDKQAISFYKKVIEGTFKNFEVQIAKNGYEAISIFKKLIPTIVITNHEMPLMNGNQLVEALQSKESSYTTPVIVFANEFDDEMLRRYEKLGVEKLLKKPVDQEQLIEAIRDCLF